MTPDVHEPVPSATQLALRTIRQALTWRVDRAREGRQERP